jgi:hypothetical protein
MLKAHQTTRFALEGAHLAVDCTACHEPTGQGRQQFVSKGTECVTCHQQNFVAAKNPDHVGGAFPRECVNCHSSTTWTRGRFNHDASSFPLTGAHRATGCMQCHAGSRYKGTPNTCLACHQSDYNQTATPKHSTAGFGTDCVTCHATSSWTSAYDHSTTQFPLTGAHRAASCSQCHADGVYAGKPTTCLSCHQTDYNTTSDPKHTLPSYPTTCLSCHTTTTWVGATFDHNATQFPLTGAHRASTCTQCHADGVYAGKPTSCVSCHQTDYNTTSNPKHTLPSYPTACQSCHTTTTWVGATFDHNATLFPLTGAHRASTCTQCHADGVYAGKPTTCVSCHQTDYTAAVSPKHTQPSFSSTCTQCHSTTAWIPSSFSHSTTTFPLTGMHVTTPCASCHLNGVYRGTTTPCESCHLSDYTTVTSPNHVQYGWPQTCISCHTGAGNTTAWDAGVTLPNQYHTMFSLNHERARGVCTECHNTTNYAQSTCSNHHHPPSCTFTSQRSCD